MGKEGDLWDDSALINAFDQAISIYEKMHGGAKHKAATPQEVETVMTGENGSNLDLASPHTTRDADANIPATDAPDSGETGDVSKLEENHQTESRAGQPCLDSTSGQDIQNVQTGYAYAQGVDDYNQLVADYYELEEKRVKILEQINQYGGWNYQYAAATASSSGVPHSSSQDYSMAAYQASDPNAVCTCCPCYSQCLPTPCTAVPECSLGGSSVHKPCNNLSVEMDHKLPFPCEDGKIHKMAMGAAEKALSTIRTTISGDFNVNEGKESNKSEPEESNGPGTDLAAVLNAWYSAGFYTGKYLVEQSIQNKSQN